MSAVLTVSVRTAARFATASEISTAGLVPGALHGRMRANEVDVTHRGPHCRCVSTLSIPSGGGSAVSTNASIIRSCHALEKSGFPGVHGLTEGIV